MWLAFEDAKSELFDVSDDDAEEQIDYEILKLKLGRDFEPESWSRSWVSIIFLDSHDIWGFDTMYRVVFLTGPPKKWPSARPLGNSDT